MATQLQIANMALRLLGAERISAVDTSTEEGRFVTDAWDMVRDDALQAYPWKFAMVYDVWEAETDRPEHTWSYSYPHISGALKVVNCPDLLTSEWTIGQKIASGGGRSILADTDGDDLNVIYIKQVTDTTVWPPCFVTYMAAKLAAAGVEDLTGSAGAWDRINASMREAMRAAYVADAIEAPPSDIPVDDWIAARL